MIDISVKAQLYFIKLLAKQKKGTYIRVSVINPGTPNAEFNISYCTISTINKDDFKLKLKKLTVYIDKLSIPYLKESKIDFIIDKLESKLIIKSPNIKISKTIKNSSLIKRIEYLLQSQINPQLAKHGGYVHFEGVSNDNYAILKFGGGCNGCSMINFTLKEGIEKQLIYHFPELKGVYDITNHSHDDNSYF